MKECVRVRELRSMGRRKEELTEEYMLVMSLIGEQGFSGQCAISALQDQADALATEAKSLQVKMLQME